MEITFDTLVTEIANAARKSFLELFENGERFYYCVLITTGEAHCPHVTAWSWEALERKAQEELWNYGNVEIAKKVIKWAYAESPYSVFRYEENFREVATLFEQLPMPYDAFAIGDETEWERRYNFRLSAMEEALRLLDNEGVFALNQPRSEVYVNVESIYPDSLDKERAFRLNEAENLAMWFEEMGQFIEGSPENLITWELYILQVGGRRNEVMKLLRKMQNISLSEIQDYISHTPILVGGGSEVEMVKLKSEFEKIGCVVYLEKCSTQKHRSTLSK